MGLKVFSIEEKIDLIDDIIVWLRKRGNRGDDQHAILTALARDLRERRDFPRNNTLGALEREIETVLASKVPGVGYDHGRLIHLGNMVVSRWPVISQALERFGEECAE